MFDRAARLTLKRAADWQLAAQSAKHLPAKCATAPASRLNLHSEVTGSGQDDTREIRHSLTAASDQLAAWRGWFDSVFDVTPRQLVDGFPAENLMWNLDGFAVGRVSGPAVQIRRTKAHIRRNPVDHWIITLGRHVTTAVSNENESLEAPAGVPFVVSLGNEMTVERPQDVRLQLYLARNCFSEIAPMLDAVRLATLNTSLGSLLADYMLLLERNLPDLTPEDLPRLTNAVRAMVGACIVPSSDRVAIAASQIDLGRLERVRRAVRTHLRSPSMGPNMLCREAGTSRSQLYRLLEQEGGVARYIQRQRLLEGHAVLCDVSNSSRIAAIAGEFCFADASGFSRAFRHEFGISPSDVRAAALAGLAPTAMPKDRVGTEVRNLSDCLRAF